MEIKQVEYFLKVVETGSFSAAADELFISQSSLSKQILALEKELGAKLFDRSRRKIAISAAGKALLPYARSLYTTYLSLLAAATPFKKVPSLSIVAIPVISQYGIPAFIAQFKRAFPTIQLTLEEREAITIVPMLTNHQYDMAFIRDNYLDKTRFEVVEVAEDQFRVILSPQHRMADRESISLAELADENFIVFDKGTVIHELTIDACRTAGFEPRIFYASLRVESILGMVASNSGVALMMQKVVEYRGHPDVVVIPLQETISSKLVLAWLKEEMHSEAVTSFANFMRFHVASR